MTSAAIPLQAIRDSEWSILVFCITSPVHCRWMSPITLYKTSKTRGSSTEACVTFGGNLCTEETRPGCSGSHPVREVRLERYLGGQHASQSRDTSFNDHSDDGARRIRRRPRRRQHGRRCNRFHGFRRLF